MFYLILLFWLAAFIGVLYWYSDTPWLSSCFQRHNDCWRTCVLKRPEVSRSNYKNPDGCCAGEILAFVSMGATVIVIFIFFCATLAWSC